MSDIQSNDYMNGFTSYGSFSTESEAIGWATNMLDPNTWCVFSLNLRPNTWWIMAKKTKGAKK